MPRDRELERLAQLAVEALEPAARAYERRRDAAGQLALAPDIELAGQLTLDSHEPVTSVEP